MPLRHSFHHGLSFLLAVVLSVLVGELIRSQLPGVFKIFDKWSNSLIRFFKLDISTKTVSIFILAFIIVIIYGFIFGILEKRRT